MRTDDAEPPEVPEFDDEPDEKLVDDDTELAHDLPAPESRITPDPPRDDG